MTRKLYFYKLNAAELFAEVRSLSDDQAGRWVKEFASDLVAGGTCNAFTQSVLDEAHNFKSKKSAAGVKGMEKRYQKANTDITLIEQCYDSVNNKAVTNNNSSTKKNKEKAEAKTIYADNVEMTATSYAELVKEHGGPFVTKCINKLSAYKEASGKTYKSDVGAIRTWVIDEVRKTHRPDSEVLF